MTDPQKQDTDHTEDPVARYSERMAELFACLAEIPPPIAEDGSRRSSDDDARAAELSSEIKRLSREMFEFRTRTASWHERKQSGSPEDNLRRQEFEAELLRLRGRLCHIADAQMSLIAERNSGSFLDRDEFTVEYRQLAKEYSELLAELQRVRARLASIA